MVGLIILMVLVGLYFLPTAIAAQRSHPNIWPIAIVNFFLGWSVLGWVAALVMASWQVRR